ncbi:MAG: T9SS type B sorting domain-containing protein [Luteibaculaceae bacterium]
MFNVVKKGLFPILFALSYLMLLPILSIGQQSVNMSTGGQESCVLTNFFDSGGAIGNYQPNEQYVFTFCPDETKAMRIGYLFLNLADGDSLFVYDGSTVNDSLLFVFSSATNFDTPEEFQEVVQISDNNTIGCVTFEFISGNNGGDAGWHFRLFCQVRCQPLLANFEGAEGFTLEDDTYINACPDEPITLNSSGIFLDNNRFYEQSNDAANFVWTFNINNNLTTIVGQNPVVSFENEGGIIVGLRVVDQFGCESTNAIEKRIRISPKPKFTGTSISDEEICLTETAFLQGVVIGDNGPSEPGKPSDLTHITPPLTLGSAGLTFLPDGNGVSYESPLFFDEFSAGQTLENIDQLLAVCINMEHSFLGDLEIKLKCPNNQQTILKAFPGGGARVLGEPIFPDDANPQPGIGYDYCFSSTPTFALMITEPTTYTVTGVNGGTRQGIPEATYPENSYTSVQSFQNLVGCPLNGAWTIVITDNLGADNGYIFSWNLTFADEVLPIPFQFTASEVARGWLPHSIDDEDVIAFDPFLETMTVMPLTPGFHNYTYRYINSFGTSGCVFDTIVSVYVKEPLAIDFQNSFTLCEGETVDIQPEIINQNGDLIFEWNENNELISNNPTLTITPQDSTIILLSIFDECPLNFSDSIFIHVNPLPNTDFTADVTEGCSPFNPTLFNLTDPTLNSISKWTIAGRIINSIEDSITTRIRFPGTYTVILEVTSAEGCTQKLIKPSYLTVFDVPVAEFDYFPKPVTLINNSPSFNNLSEGNISNMWFVDQELIAETENMTYQFNEQGIFEVTLEVLNQYGCVDSVTKFIRVTDEFTLYIPNSFTPNSDGNNDIFRPFANHFNPESYNMQIYDRFGNLIFESSSIEFGWDGKINGNEAPIGTYVYQISLGRKDGGFAESKTGTINLIR